MPSALVSATASRPSRRPAATVAPNTPHTEVGWKPRWRNSTGAAMPTRIAASEPAITAAVKSRPVAPAACAAANAAGTIVTLTCMPEAVWVSS